MTRPARPWPQIAVGCSIVLMGAVAVWQAAAIPESPISGQVGSAAFPWLIGMGITVLGLILTLQAVRTGWVCNATDPAEPAMDLKAFGWILLAYASTLASLAVTGSFILSATILFTLGVRAFARGLWVKSALFGLLAGSATYLLFSVGLGLQIGQGMPERALEWAIPF